MSHTDPPAELIALAEELRDLMHGHFIPAKDEGDASQVHTTGQLHALMQQHVPDKFPLEHFRDLMLQAGFIESHVGGHWYWLLKSPY